MVSIWLLGNDKAVSISQVSVYISVTKSKYVSKNPTGCISYQNIIHIIEIPSLYFTLQICKLRNSPREIVIKILNEKLTMKFFLSVWVTKHSK